MNSWAVSACYPRSTFYPLSDGPSIQNHRITKTYFRTCLIRRSCSQARFCLCTHCAMSDRAERTFVLLRYSLGGDRPSQTTHQALSASPIQGPALEHQTYKGGISRTAPAQLASRLQSLPPILHLKSLLSIINFHFGTERNRFRLTGFKVYPGNTTPTIKVQILKFPVRLNSIWIGSSPGDFLQAFAIPFDRIQVTSPCIGVGGGVIKCFTIFGNNQI